MADKPADFPTGRLRSSQMRRTMSSRVSELVSRFEPAGSAPATCDDSDGVIRGNLTSMDWRERTITPVRRSPVCPSPPRDEVAVQARARAATPPPPTALPVSADEPLGRGETKVVESSDARAVDPFDDRFAEILSKELPDDQDPLLAELLAAAKHPPSALGSTSEHPADTEAAFPPARRAVPLYRLFARDAAPLNFPGLDEAIVALGSRAEFSASNWPGTTVSKPNGSDDAVAGGSDQVKRDEQEAWQAWVRDGPSRSASWFTRLARFLRLSAKPDTGSERARRAEIFPPFHRLPPGVTVTDLKQNRRRPLPLLTAQSLLSIVGNAILGAAGSAKGISLTTVESLRDLMQIVTLLVTSGSPRLRYTPEDRGVVRTVFVIVPAFLSLDFVTAFGQALVLLLILTLVTLLALHELMQFTGGWRGPSAGLRRGHLDAGEGYDAEGAGASPRKWRDSRAYRIAITFWCTSIYLPLSKLAIGALIFTDDYWPVTNPYTAFASDHPSPDPLGPAEEYYPPLDFCYRTSMKRGAPNFVYIFLPLAGLVVLTLSLWLPWRLRSVVELEKPKADPWTELGERRRDVDAEYQRLLEVDRSLFSFLYKDFRRPWAAFRSIYLVFKLLNVLLVVLVQKNNCAFRSYPTVYLSVIRQGSLLAFLTLYSLFAMRTLPYLDIPSNSSDVCSRIGYSFLAMLGLLAALGVQHTDPATLTVNVLIYTLSGYFVVISMSWAQRCVKRLSRRIDFSIDIFSPLLDVDKHILRRVWQETVATIFLCSPELAMPPEQKLSYSSQVAPYLLNFSGSPAERFVEDLKILRAVGLPAYRAAIARDRDPKLASLREVILADVTGPDRYFAPDLPVVRTSSQFGRVDVVPFPFTVIFRYDQSPADPLHLTSLQDLERLIQQNATEAVQSARRVRLALRALEGQIVFAPHVEPAKLDSRTSRSVSYRKATLRISRNSSVAWKGSPCASGFDVRLEYADGETVEPDGRVREGLTLVRSGAQIGITPLFQLTPALATLFRQNRALVEANLHVVESHLEAHRTFFARELRSKVEALDYAIVDDVFFERNLEALALRERRPEVRDLAYTHEVDLRLLQERYAWLSAEPGRRWWYLLWDDLWRRNRFTVQLADEYFSPHYRLSICYEPMPRQELECFLRARGFGLGRRAVFHAGLLNKIYLRMDEIVQKEVAGGLRMHLADQTADERVTELARRLLAAHPQPEPDLPSASRRTAMTGDGVAEDDAEIRQRKGYLWEEALVEPEPPCRPGTLLAFMRFRLTRRLPQHLGIFFGLRPVVPDWRPGPDDEVLVDLPPDDSPEPGLQGS